MRILYHPDKKIHPSGTLCQLPLARGEKTNPNSVSSFQVIGMWSLG